LYVVGAGLVVSRTTPTPDQPVAAMSNPALPVTIRYFAFDTEWPFEMTILLG
jgi:hypothetical protein